jgi:hypothetical protein
VVAIDTRVQVKHHLTDRTLTEATVELWPAFTPDIGDVRDRPAMSGLRLPYRDDDSWEFKGTMHFTEQERARYDAEEARFKEAHGDCRTSRHSVSG